MSRSAVSDPPVSRRAKLRGFFLGAVLGWGALMVVMVRFAGDVRESAAGAHEVAFGPVSVFSQSYDSGASTLSLGIGALAIVLAGGLAGMMLLVGLGKLARGAGTT